VAQKTAYGKEWFPAIYARLSDEDDRKGVSLSIEHQLEILREFVKRSGWHTPKEFFDDDKTGTDFNRKGFQDMYAEAKSGSVNVIAIKDTSRFGRNWVQSGMYFEAIEEMGVRFVSLEESLDTIDPKCPALKMLPFYFIFNEWHSQTTSEKIRTVLKHNAQSGKYRATYAPYGYVKDPDDKHKLLVDPIAASIIRRIYEMRLQKLSYGAIVGTLNKEGVPSPSAYRAETGGKPNIMSRRGQWSKDCLTVIFQNPAYRGDTANGKKTVVSYKNHTRVRRPMSEWIIVENTHEAIISREDWQKCFDMMTTLGRVRRTKESEVLPFTGLLVCADCGCSMRHNHSYYMLKSGEKRRHDGYNCSMYYTSGNTACFSHYISEKDLIEIVLGDIRKKAGFILHDENAARERFHALKSKSDGTRRNADKAALNKVVKRLAELERLIQAAFEKSVLDGAFSETFEDMARRYEDEKRDLTARAERLTETVEQHDRTQNDVDTFIALMEKHVNITEIDRAAAVELIDHITVSASSVKPREITIYYNFVGNVE
jgi:DNA invertase Pin-like site-specific DNA recombinase